MRLLYSLFVSYALAFPAAAHEFWISPVNYIIAAQGQLIADIRVGQNFKGAPYSYIPNKFVRFDLVAGENIIPVEGRLGDQPALSMAAPGEGLVTIVHQTSDYFLTYTKAETFVNFVTSKDFDGVLEAHAARGLPEKGFRERYSRYGKSLVSVGNGAGSDREIGMETEVVALANPYTDDVSGGFPVQFLYQGKPRADIQVDLFDRAPGAEAVHTKLRTDADGKVLLPVTPGHEYLADAVVMRQLQPVADNDPVWESLWASLTFMVPAQ